MDDTDLLVRKYAVDLVGEATGGKSYYMEKVAYRDEITRDGILDVLREARVPFAIQLISDIEQIFDGEEPRYFVPHDRVVERYRENHYFGTSFAEPDFGLRPFVFELGVQLLQKELAEWRKYGVSLEPYRDGAACVAEQDFFYDTQEWKNRATAVRIIDRFTCQDCGRSGRDKILHVHHDEHIYSVFSRKFEHNCDVGRLRCLCELCHRNFHRIHGRGYSHFVSAEGEERSRITRQRLALEKLHDALRECQFCFRENRKAA